MDVGLPRPGHGIGLADSLAHYGDLWAQPDDVRDGLRWPRRRICAICVGPPTRPKIRTVTSWVHEAAHLLHYLSPGTTDCMSGRGPGEVRRRRLLSFTSYSRLRARYSRVVLRGGPQIADLVRREDAEGGPFIPTGPRLKERLAALVMNAAAPGMAGRCNTRGDGDP